MVAEDPDSAVPDRDLNQEPDIKLGDVLLQHIIHESMLKELHIHNYFLINKLTLDFSKGLTLITGETGAGKSVLIGAISLLLGEKIDRKMLFDPDEKCIIEGSFDIENLQLKSFFEENELDYLPETIVRREISAGAIRSRAFINDTPVTNIQLKEFGLQLIDIHSQHETLQLNNPLTQLQIVDRYGKLEQKVVNLKTLFTEIKDNKIKLKEQENKLEESLREQDFRQYALQELEEAHIKPNEAEELEEELKLVGNADALKIWLEKIYFTCQEEEPSLVGIIDIFTAEGRKVSVENKIVQQIIERLHSVSCELADIARDAQNFSETLNNDPERLQQIEIRLDTINRMVFKYHVHHAEQLSSLIEEYRTQVEGIQTLQTNISDLQNKIIQQEEKWEKQALEIRKHREVLLPDMSQKMTCLLQLLGMPEASFIIKHEKLDLPTDQGLDRIQFLFSANKGRQPAEIRTVASGGELSRIMLSIKNLMSHTKLFPTMIFDEIDSGISGAVATKAGEMMRNMAKTKQIITITHLPTIAAFADQHLYVAKESNDSGARISVRYLSYEERIKEIAHMLSGDHTMQEALETAAKLLQSASKIQ